MPSAASATRSSGLRLIVPFIGFVFLGMNVLSFREQYLLQHSGTPLQATVTQTSLIRRRGSVAYRADYEYTLSGKRYSGNGLVGRDTYITLLPGRPVAVRYVPSDPSISEPADMSHNTTSMFVIAALGMPVSLFMICFPFLKKPPPQISQVPPRDTIPIQEPRIELPAGVRGIAFTMYPVTDMARARKFYEGELGLRPTRDLRGEWIEYHLWDSCFALSAMAPGVKPSADSGGRIALEVSNVDDQVKQLRNKGFQIKVEPFSTPVCRMAVVIDSEGNAITLHQKTTY